QECIKPVKIEKKNVGTGSKIKIESDGSYTQIDEAGVKEKLGRVDISLTDCLACSGCITTAETVLINQQSHDEMLRVFRNKSAEGYKLIVASLALQPILSLAVCNKITPDVCLGKISGLLKRLGADMVLDIGIAEDFALVEEQKEFTERYNNSVNGNSSALPMLASTCPGWVCYAEKTKGSLLPNLSSTRSPQQIAGTLVKKVLASRMNLAPNEVYHVTLMPCYDKKLEASRSQFATGGVRDVDCVITPVELNLLLEDNCPDGLLGESTSEIDWPWDIPKFGDPLTRPEGSGSGGYAHQVMSHAAQSLFGYSGPITFNNVRKSDFQEAVVEVEGKSLKFAVATGFKNIQNLMNKIKRGKCDYHYIEIMACPSGCLNGGALIKGQLNQVKIEHESLNRRHPEEIHSVYDSLLGSNDFIEKNLHTQFEEVTYNPNPLNIKW
ncbi:hypothetical protein AAG570_003612, partial [Ranatra chinensis]